MTAPTKRASAKRAATKRSPRAAAKPAPAAEPTLTDDELDDLATPAEDTPPAPGEIRPVIIGKRGRRGDAPVAMVTLFELDGVEYKIPRNPSAAHVLQWIANVDEDGDRVAAFKMAIELLGQKALDDLKRSPEVEPEDIADIFGNIGIVFFTSENYRKIMEAPDPS